MKLHPQHHTIIQYKNKRGNATFNEVVKIFYTIFVLRKNMKKRVQTILERAF